MKALVPFSLQLDAWTLFAQASIVVIWELINSCNAHGLKCNL